MQKEFELSLEHYNILKNKIYNIFKNNLSEIHAETFSPNIELLLYDPDELFLVGIILEYADAIELPSELIYQNTKLDKYFDYDKNDILTITKFTDILINIFIEYQTQLQKFQSLSADKREKYYYQLYQIIKNHISIKDQSFSPDIIINSDQVNLSERKSKKIIEQSAIIIGLNKKELYKYFQDQNFFKLPDPLIIFKIPIYCIPFIINFIFNIFQWVITGKWQFQFFSHQKLEPITAKKFADILINLWLMK